MAPCAEPLPLVVPLRTSDSSGAACVPWFPCHCHSERVSKVGKDPVWAEEKLCLASRRRSQTVEISRKESEFPPDIHALHASREAIDHFSPLENINTGRDEFVRRRDWKP